MANKRGLRSFQFQLTRGFRPAKNFEVRYWTVKDIKSAFHDAIGDAKITADCYFGLGWQWSDFHLMTLWLRPILIASEILRRISRWLEPLNQVADSVFCTSRKAV